MEVVQGPAVKGKIDQIAQHVFQAGTDEIASVRGVVADEETEGRRLEFAALEIALGHGQLV